MCRKIFLIGLPGVGKTTYGKLLAQKLGLDFLDLDHQIETNIKKSIPEIFEQYGETFFREKERDRLRFLVRNTSDFVLATGGGTPCFFDNITLMNTVGTTIYLNFLMSQIVNHLSKDHSRPLLQKHSLETLYHKRKYDYEKAKHHVTSPAALLGLFDGLK